MRPGDRDVSPVGPVSERAWSIPLTIAHLAATEGEMHDHLADAGVVGHAAFVAQLVVEEIVRNLIEHAGPSGAADVAVVRLVVDAERVTVTIEDTRPAFDPFTAPSLDTRASLEERRAGGMGLHLVRELADRLAYERVGAGNRLTASVTRA